MSARGALYAAPGWLVETVQLDMVPRSRKRGNGDTGTSHPDGDGSWLLAKRPGQVFWVRTPQELASLGVPMTEMIKVWEW